jgi:predicted DNA-binding protein
MAKKRILVLVEPDLYDRINVLSRQTGVSVAEIAGSCIKQSLEVVEKAIFTRPEVQAYIREQKKLNASALDTLRCLQRDSEKSS